MATTIYTPSMLRGAGTRGVPEIPVGSSNDSDAQAFIDAASITNATQQTAINTLVVSLKDNSLWTNMKAIYPIVGGTSTTHKYNLKDPQDTDAAFRLTFSGGWTHSANGALPNGTNARGDTHFVPNDDFSSFNELALGYYSRSLLDASSLGYDMGAFQSGKVTGLILMFLDKFRYALNQTSYELASNTHTDGFFVANRSGAGGGGSTQAYRNGSLHSTGNQSTAASGATISMYIGAFSGGGLYGNKECAFAFVYDGSLDATENSNLYDAVQAFNTTLSRQV